MTTAARSLHTILTELEAVDAPTIHAKWQTVLDCQHNTTDFALRHAAVVSLWQQTMNSINALPASSTRERRLAYGNLWWRAITIPDRAWGEQKNQKVIEQGALDVLDVTADHLDHLDGDPQPLPENALMDLRILTEEWIERLETSTGISRGLKVSIVEHLTNVMWLIDNAGRFGRAAVVVAAEGASGALLRAAVETRQPKSWGTYLARFASATTLVAGGLTSLNLAIDEGQEVVREVQGVVSDAPDPDAASTGGP